MGIPPYRAARHAVALAGRVTWKDCARTTRFAAVITRNISETGVFIEWWESTAIPLYRLVSFSSRKDARNIEGLPRSAAFGQSALGRVSARRLSEIDRNPEGYGLRLLIEPRWPLGTR